MAYTVDELKSIVQLLVENKLDCVKMPELEIYKSKHEFQQTAHELMQGALQEPPKEMTPKDLDNLMGGLGYGV